MSRTLLLFICIATLPITALAQTGTSKPTVPTPTVPVVNITPSITKDGTVTATVKVTPTTSATVTPKITSDGTAVTITPKPTTDGTAVGVAGATKSKPLPKQKVIYKNVDPGFKTPPIFRTAPLGPNAVWGGFGVKAGVTDNSTGGFLVNLGYSYRLTRKLWADVGFSMNFGGDCARPAPDDDGYICGGMNGFGLDILGGLMWRFLDQPKWDLPLNPYVKALGGVSFIISNGPNDGAATILKGVGGARYSFTDEFAVGAAIGRYGGQSEPTC